MDTTFHVYKKLDIFERAEIAEARMKYEWGKGYKESRHKDRTFWTNFNDLIQLLAIGFHPDETRKQVQLICSYHLVSKYFKIY